MNFIKLHLPDNNGLTWVNMDLVHEVRANKESNGATLWFAVSVDDGTDDVTVTETPDDIMNMI